MHINGDIGQLSSSVDNGRTVINVHPGGIGQVQVPMDSTPEMARVGYMPLGFSSSDEVLLEEDRRCQLAIRVLRKRLYLSVPAAWNYLGWPVCIWCGLHLLQPLRTGNCFWLYMSWAAIIATLPGLVWYGEVRDRLGKHIQHFRRRRETIEAILIEREMRLFLDPACNEPCLSQQKRRMT